MGTVQLFLIHLSASYNSLLQIHGNIAQGKKFIENNGYHPEIANRYYCIPHALFSTKCWWHLYLYGNITIELFWQF